MDTKDTSISHYTEFEGKIGSRIAPIGSGIKIHCCRKHCKLYNPVFFVISCVQYTQNILTWGKYIFSFVICSTPYMIFIGRDRKTPRSFKGLIDDHDNTLLPSCGNEHDLHPCHSYYTPSVVGVSMATVFCYLVEVRTR